jgi:uncharacterized protein YbaR (Trm112 family)
MAKVSIVCPHCNKQKLEIHYEDEKEIKIKKVKGGTWDFILTKVDESHWTADPTKGIDVKCKCGKHSLVYGIFRRHDAILVHGVFRGLDAIRIENEVTEHQILGGFCTECREAYLGRTLVCPTCGSTS